MPESNATALVFDDLSFQYNTRSEPAIQHISFSVQPGELLLIAGSSGCGKTTLMRCANGLIPNAYHGKISGDLKLFGRSVFDMQMAEISQAIGTLLQDPERQILGSYVLNEVGFGLERTRSSHALMKRLSTSAFSICAIEKPLGLQAGRSKRLPWPASWS